MQKQINKQRGEAGFAAVSAEQPAHTATLNMLSQLRVLFAFLSPAPQIAVTMHLTVISKGSGDSCLPVPLCISTTRTCATMTYVSSPPCRNLVPGFQQWHGITSTSRGALTCGCSDMTAGHEGFPPGIRQQAQLPFAN